jgi:septal ring factor EnvC (AmiA/AmiB activator)
MNEEQLSKHFLSIERQLAELSVTAKSIQKELTKMNGSVHELRRSEGAQNERLARLEVKAGFLGALGGALVAGFVGAVRWMVER